MEDQIKEVEQINTEEPAVADETPVVGEPIPAEEVSVAEEQVTARENAAAGEPAPAAEEQVTAGQSDTAEEPAPDPKVSKKEIKEKRRKKWFWVRLVVFVCIALMVLTYFIYVLTPKYPYGICSIFNYYRTEEGTVDVLALGTSLSYTDLNTNILWSEYGIACYDLGTAEQPFWSTYYYLVEAVKYQKPKLVLLDLKAISYLEDKVDRTRTVLCSFGLLNPISRLHCIYECVEPEEFWGYALAFSQIHTNYYKTKGSDFVIPPDNGGRGSSWKGYIEKNDVAEHDAPAINFGFATPSYVNEHEAEYFEKILQFCVENEINLLLVGYPNADYKHDHLYYCAAWEIAQKYNIPCINYNLPENSTGINYKTDCADWQHLNVSGSVKFTRAVAEDLIEYYHLEDHRGDPAYASYDECAELWFEKYPYYKTNTSK